MMKKRFLKKTLSLLLALVMLIGMMPTRAFATEEQHTHSYTPTVTASTCTEQGYTTYTCACGDSCVDDYVEATGEHSYKNGICVSCGATKPDVPYDQLSTVWPSINTDLTHIICYGQSFSNGSDAPYFHDPIVDNVYIYGSITNSANGTELQHLNDSTGNQHPVISAVNVLSQMLTAAGIDTDIIAGSYGAGGRTIAQLMSAERQAQIKEEEGYTYDINSSGRYAVFQSSVSAIAGYAEANDQTVSCPAIVYLQGETDQNTDEQLGYPDNPIRAGYGAGGDKEKYKEYMSRLKEDMQREVMEAYGQTEKPLFLIYQVSGTYTRTQYSSINMAQIEFAQENEDVILVQSPYFTSHYTNSHHLTQNGYRWLGEYIGRSIYTALVEREKLWPMLPENIEITGSNSMRITVSGVQNGLTIDTWTVENASNIKNLYGFYLQVDGKNIVPTQISVYGNIIDLTLPTDLVAENVYLYYAGKNASGTGNIRDNSAELGFYEYLDDSNDTGTGNNQGVSHSALDADGNSIVGQKYPLYNWLSAFCYAVEVPESEQRQPAYYHWEMQDAGLVSVTEKNTAQNNLTLLQGSVDDGVLNKVQYAMEKDVVLEYDRPWAIEWKAAGKGNGYYGGKLLSTTVGASCAQYLYIPADSRGMVAWGVGSDSANYGFQLGKQGVDIREEHTYRIENRIADSGVNTVYLIVDGVEIGAMTTGYRTSANASGAAGSMIEEPNNWANGKNVYLNCIGAGGSFLLNNMKLSYLKIWEDTHTHTYTPTVTAPTCTEQGYTTYTCACGDSYVDDYVDATGHSYKSGTCTICGADHPNLANYKGKVISILGGSNCTYAGYIPVADGFNLAHRARYPQDNLLTDVNDTWWMQALAVLDAKLGINDSWAGSQVLNTLDSNSGDLGPDAAMASLTRIQNLGSNGTPDVILFFGGCNDMGRGVTLGSFDSASASVQADLTATKWDSFADAYVAAILRMRHFYPDAQILVMLPYNSPSYFTAAKVETYGAVVKAICDHYGVTYVDLRDCGITSSDLPDGIHPNAAGSYYITDAVLSTLLSDVDVEAGEHVVYSVKHSLTNAFASLSYYQGVSAGKPFVETVSGESVTVTMGGADITDAVLTDGVISIPAVTGDLVITAKGKFDADGRLQQLPEHLCAGTNLWTALEPVNEYYTTSGWGNNSNSNYSVTFPVAVGERVWATSFGKAWSNGYSANAVRITWFSEEGVLESLSRDVVYEEFAEYGYLTVPEGAIAVNIPMATNDKGWEIYLLDRSHSYTSIVTAPTCIEQGYTTYTCTFCGDSYMDDYVEVVGHTYERGICTGCGKKVPSLAGKKISILGDSISTYGGVSNNTASNSTIGDNAAYYSGQGGIARADTWWQQSIDVLGMELLVNNSWSGSCVFQPRKGEASVGYTDRCINLHNDYTGEEPDVILVFLGTNDFKNFPSTIGEETDIDYETIISQNEDGTYTYATATSTCEAYAIMLHKMTVRYPDADIYCMNLLPRKAGSNQPTDFNEDVARIAARFGCAVIDLENCGFASDSESMNLYMYDGAVHPSKEGMDLITQAVVSELTSERIVVHDVEVSVSNVVFDNNHKSCISGDSFHAVITAINPKEDVSVTVTMAEEDISNVAWNGSEISISSVTGDIAIVAVADRGDISFRWDYSDGELTNVVSDAYVANELIKRSGTTVDGIFHDSSYRTQYGIELLHDRPWVIAWNCEGTGGFMLSDGTSAASSSMYFRRHVTGLLHVFGVYEDGKYHHYGIKPGHYDVDASSEHNYRLENRILDDGSNMVYLYVDGIELGPMNHYFVGYADQNCTIDWVAGKDFYINYIGTDSHPIDKCSLDYLAIWENGHTHSYTSETNSPECTTEGYTTHTCACGDSYVDSFVDALGHSYGAWQVTDEATCTETGEERRDCDRCDHYETQTIPAVGHSYTTVVTAPTCTEQGFTTHTCTACGDSYVDSYVDALGHSFGAWQMTDEATCTETGEERRDCERCDHYETQIISAKGHSYTSVVTLPTCTEQGFSTHTCECGDSYVDSYVDALGHSFGAWQATVDATCTETGEERRDCERCDHYETQTIPAVGHSHTTVVTAPTCTEQGFSTHTCACSDSYVDSFVDALGHSYGAWQVMDEPTCTETGEERRDCERCDHYETQVIEVLGHSYTTVVTAPTCTKRGFSTHTCTCGDSYVDSFVDALGHSYGAWQVTDEATCTETGEERRDCERCDHYESQIISAKGHCYTSVVTLPTCTEQGFSTHSCACGDSYVDSFVDALGHKYGAWQVTDEPTCTETGEERRDCERCDAYETQPIPATGHSYTAIVTPPTCTAQGYTTHTCACGDSYVDSYVDTLGHSYGAWQVTDEATCTETGEERRDCERCDAYETQPIPAKGHSHTSIVTAPTCAEQGYTTHTCACGDSHVDTYVDALGHSYGAWQVTDEATCTETGEQRRDCERCDHYETQSIPATGHSYTSVVTPPTCTEQGYTTYTCDCGDNYVDSYVDALGHTPGEAVRENETSNSYDEVVYCIVCGDELSRTTVATHIPGDINGDGTVNNKDATRLFQYLAGWKVVVVESALDVNGDGAINNKDATRLFQYLAGWNVIIY